MLNDLIQQLTEGRKEQFIAIMPNEFLLSSPSLKTEWNKEVNWALTTLKKQDRVTWYLKIVKLYLLDSLIDEHKLEISNLTPQLKANAEVQIKRLLQWLKLPAMPHISLNTIKSHLSHYLSLNLPAIDKVVFTNQKVKDLEDTFAGIEQEWKEKTKSVIPHHKISDTTTLVLEFQNGWQWVNLNQMHCTIEGNAMGHCGNTGNPHPNDTILSLREPVQGGWKPHLTFIFDKETGLLGEMKGRNNDKPAAKYHPYILKLLELPMIKGIKGGGYLPGHNFAISDLTKEQQEELIKVHPHFANLLTRFRKFGLTHEIINEIKEKIHTINDFGMPEYKDDKWIISKWKIDAFRDLSTYTKYLTGDKTLDFDVSTEETKDFFDQLPHQTQQQIEKYLEEKYADQIEEDFDWDSLYQIANENSDDLIYEFSSAVNSGYESGTIKEIDKAVRKYLEDPVNDNVSLTPDAEYIHTSMVTGKEENDPEEWGTEFWLTSEAMCKLLDGNLLEEYNDWDEFVTSNTEIYDFEGTIPQSGFNDYDKHAAIEYFFETSQFNDPKNEKKVSKNES